MDESLVILGKVVIDVNMETMAPATLVEVLKKFYVEVRKQDGSEYEPDSLEVMQAAGEILIHSQISVQHHK